MLLRSWFPKFFRTQTGYFRTHRRALNGRRRVSLASVVNIELLESRALLAVDPILVKDIDAPLIEGLHPENLTNVGGMLYFTANDGVTGYELWKLDAPPLAISSINRSSPAGQFTNLTSVTFLATFSEQVTGVNTNDLTDCRKI